jgi:hypothetical protein
MTPSIRNTFRKMKRNMETMSTLGNLDNCCFFITVYKTTVRQILSRVMGRELLGMELRVSLYRSGWP